MFICFPIQKSCNWIR